MTTQLGAVKETLRSCTRARPSEPRTAMNGFAFPRNSKWRSVNPSDEEPSHVRHASAPVAHVMIARGDACETFSA